jgi:hypothetical protein
VSPFQPTGPAQRDPSIQSERRGLAAGTEPLRESVAPFSGPRSSHLDSRPHQKSCCIFHIWLRFSRFSSPHRSFCPGPELLEEQRAGPPKGRVLRRNLDFRRIEASLHDHTKRRGKVIVHKRYDRSGRRLGRDHPAASLPTRQPDLSRVRIAREPKATLLQHEHAPFPPDSCAFFKSLGLIPRNCMTIRLVTW